MKATHRYFEILCTLATSNQLTATELAELQEHAEHCVCCRDLVVDTDRMSARIFLVHTSKTPQIRLPKGMQERFAARARNEGIPLNSSSSSMVVLPASLGLATALLLVLWMVAAPLKDDLPPRSVAQIEPAKTYQISKMVTQEEHLSHDALSRALPTKALISRTSGRRHALRINQDASSSATQTFMPRHPFTLSYSSPESTSAVPWKMVKRNTSYLSSGYKHDSTDILGFRSNLIALAYPAAQTSSRTLDLNAYKMPLKAEFKADLAAFQLTQNRVQ